MIRVLKPMYGELLANVEQYSPSYWKNIIRYASEIPKTEGITIYPLMQHSGGMTVELYDVKPPRWLLYSISNAIKNVKLMEKLKGAEEKVKEKTKIKLDPIVEKVLSLRKEGMGIDKIAKRLKLGNGTISNILKDYEFDK